MKKEEIKNKLTEEYKKLEEEYASEEYKSRIINNNRFEEKFMSFFGCFSFPFMIFFFATVIGGNSLLTSIFPARLIPLVILGASLGIGTAGYNLLEKKFYKFKEKIKDITDAKKEIELLEEAMNHKLNYSVAYNKMKAINTLLEKLDKNEMVRCASNLNSKLTEEEINKKINELEKELSEGFNELTVATKRKELAKKFWKSRDIMAPISDALVIPTLIGVLLMMVWNLPVSLAGTIPSALELLLPLPLASIVGVGYIIKRTKDNKKVYKKINSELGDNSLPKKRKYLEDDELKKKLQEKINKVCFIGEDLIKHQELLELRNNSLKENFEGMKNDKEKEVSAIKRLVDGDPVNKNPLTDVSEPIMRLYGIDGEYFETEEELKDYCKNNNCSIKDSFIVDYMGAMAGRRDVIRETNKDGKVTLYNAVDEDGYATYNHDRSVYRGEFIWEYNYGGLRNLYSLFRDRGIVFNNDVYAKIDEYYKNIFDLFKDNEISGYKSEVDKEQTSDEVKVLRKENKTNK